MTAWSPALGALLIPASWLALSASLVGVGASVHRTAAGRWADLRALETWAALFWVGVGSTVLLLQLWHFLLPVTGVLLALVMAGGLAGLPPALAGLRGVDGPRPRLAPGLLVPAALLTVWLGNRASGPLEAYDSGMYHVPAMWWAESFPIVPGLGNLHGRLAFNNSHFLLSALLDNGPWSGLAPQLLNGLLLLPMLALGLVGLHHLWERRAEDAGMAAFDAALLPAVVVYALHPRNMSSLGAEVPILAALAFSVRSALRLSRGGRGPSRELMVLAGSLAAASAISFKVTAAVAGAGVLAWIAVVGLRDVDLRRVTLVASSLVVVLGVSWLGRGVVLSGYPVYPSTALGMPVPWRVPVEQASAERAWIGHFARTIAAPRAPYAPLDGAGAWLPGWLRLVVRDAYYRWVFAFPLGLGAMASAWLFAVLVRGRRRPPGREWYGVIGLALVAAVLLASQAPRPEFIATYLWLLAAAAVAGAAGDRPGRPLAAAVILVTTTPVLAPPALEVEDAGAFAEAVLRRALVTSPPGPEERTDHVPGLETFRTASGLVLQVPREDNRCFSAPHPCTPHPAPNLRLRRPGDGLSSGFVVDGSWQPARWPNPWNDFLGAWRRGGDGAG